MRKHRNKKEGVFYIPLYRVRMNVHLRKYTIFSDFYFQDRQKANSKWPFVRAFIFTGNTCSTAIRTFRTYNFVFVRHIDMA